MLGPWSTLKIIKTLEYLLGTFGGFFWEIHSSMDCANVRYPSSDFAGDTYTYFAGMSMAVVGILGHFRFNPQTGLLTETKYGNFVNLFLRLFGRCSEKSLCIRLLIFQI
ncbi:uncharacterized protein [Typha angustifolia]|uniref:uncharacterized protein isoform X2 n=1 Tax=Typha angustifolia TaxID=59011 RepID=UPI003C2C6634